MTPAPLEIRPARPDDAAAIAALADGLRAMLGDPQGHLTAERILTDGFGPRPEFSILVAARDGVLAGYALFLDAYEPAFAARGLYLADLFVTEAARGQGIGRALIEAVSEAARARGRGFLWWVAQERNAAALAFYRRLEPEHCHPVIAHALLVRAQETPGTPP